MEEKENITNEAPVVENPAVEAPVENAPVAEKPVEKKPKAPKQKPVPAEDFDWTSSHKKFDNYTADERAKLEEKYAGTMSQVADHDVIEGTVVAITDREVVVNIGFKSDGVIPVAEFRTNPNLKVGDKVEVYVENQEGPNGQLILSHKKAELLKSWDRVNEAHDTGEIVNGYVKSRTKGGLIVEVFGLEAFLPGSQIDVKPIRDYDVFVDSVMEFKVVKINQEFKNVVVSHKALIEDELEAQKAEIISKLEKGQILEGVVKNITSYGVFIDLGLHHGDELIVGIGVLGQFGHFYHEGGEHFLFQHLAADGELALHQRIPLLEAVDTLDESLDVHLAVAYLGVVDVVLAGDDVNLVAEALPNFFGDGCRQAGHAFVGLAEALSEGAELKSRLRHFADFHFFFCHFLI